MSTASVPLCGIVRACGRLRSPASQHTSQSLNHGKCPTCRCASAWPSVITPCATLACPVAPLRVLAVGPLRLPRVPRRLAPSPSLVGAATPHVLSTVACWLVGGYAVALSVGTRPTVPLSTGMPAATLRKILPPDGSVRVQPPCPQWSWYPSATSSPALSRHGVPGSTRAFTERRSPGTHTVASPAAATVPFAVSTSTEAGRVVPRTALGGHTCRLAPVSTTQQWSTRGALPARLPSCARRAFSESPVFLCARPLRAPAEAAGRGRRAGTACTGRSGAPARARQRSLPAYEGRPPRPFLRLGRSLPASSFAEG